MRFLLDEDLSPKVAEIARGLDLDVVSVHEIDRRGLSDLEQLRFAAAQGRILVTRNRDDFIALTVAFYQVGEPSAGILIVPYSLPNQYVERIAHALKRWDESRGADEEPLLYLVDFLTS